MASFQYKAKLPIDIQQKIVLLSEHQNEISRLESQLQKARTSYELLESELLEYRLDVDSVNSEVAALQPDVVSRSALIIGIQVLPDEMLLHVFEYFLSRYHRGIGGLLKVCKRWHSIVTQSPTLWARIEIASLDYNEHTFLNHSPVSYIEACLQRSRSLLLDIEVDYEGLRSREGYIRDAIETSVRNIADEDQGGEVFDWTLGLRCDFSSSGYDVYLDDMLNALDVLVGPGGVHMERWKGVNLRVPSWCDAMLAFDIWIKFIGGTPHLEHANFGNLISIVDLYDDMSELGTCFPALSKLRSLTLDDAAAVNVLLSKLTISHSSLQHLDIHYDRYPADISALSQFPCLRRLTLRMMYPEEFQISARLLATEPPLVRLHDLRQLTLWGNCHTLKHVKFDLPILQELRIDSMYLFCAPSGLSPARIRWTFLGHRSDHWTPETIRSAFLELLQLSSRIEVLIVQESVRTTIPGVLSELRQTASLPASLRSVVVELDGGDRIVIPAT